MTAKREMRCARCGRLLCITDGNTEIVCHRCGGKNRLNIGTGDIHYVPKKSKYDVSNETMNQSDRW